MKVDRRKKILELISENEIITQEGLARLLIESGFDVTQATVSRDIKKLGLVKLQTGTGTSKYALPPRLSGELGTDTGAILKSGITSITAAQNIVVIKCPSGLANAVCVSLEKLELKGLAGMLAGDDTIFIAAADNESAENIKQRIRQYLS